jgi:prepilin-type N-terminal cleavage/methylation domain-containing protein
MRRLRSDQRGFTLVEVLIVCALFLVVLGATLAAFTSFTSNHRRTEIQHDQAEEARLALDTSARQLRNLANPTTTATATIFRASDYDLIFQTSDPNKTWVRYCVDTMPPASVGRARLWEAESAGALSGSMTAAGTCPGTGWAKAHVVSANISNRVGAIDRNVFTYECAPGWAASCPAGLAEYPRITNVGIELYVDALAGDSIKEMRVSTAVYLRNQNEPPTAAATWTRTGIKAVILNASGSADPEGRTLHYYWFKGTAPTSADLADCNATPANAIGEGITLSQQFTQTAGTLVNYWLVVRDPGCLTATSTPIPVVVPS